MDAGNDKREGLREGTCLSAGDGRQLTVGREIGRGAVSIVYDGSCVDRIGVQHRVRIRECCPDGLSFKRDREGALIVSPADQSRFEEARRRFRESYRRNVRMRNQPGLVNSTVNAGDLIEGNQTCYAVVAFDEGTDYRVYQDASLKELFGHIRSLAELIGRYHENGYLHLDIKPENVLVIPETEEHVLLFDFDSVVTMEELREDPSLRLTYSEGFSAPEQRQGRRGRIGCHTDIYSIGALAFYKIFGRRPAADDGRLSAVYDFSGMRYADRRYPPKLYREMTGFFRRCLSVSTVSRWNHMAPVLEMLEELIRLSDLERCFVYDSFQYNSGCFIGRAEELRRLYETLQERQLVFLSGMGGIGKTEIAKRYAQTYRQEYDTIVYTIYGISVEELVNQEILVNGMEQEEEESSRAYFERKLHAMRESLTPDDLIILDNFDVDQDEDLELLLACPCRFIITTREDFRDYGYPQLEIDRMESMDEILQLFDAYNDCDYTGPERDAVRQILTLVDGHTMTVELIAKYLRDTGERPQDLYQRFLEKEGTANTDGIRIRQRKDRSLRAKSVNDHIRILFDVSGFSPMEEELIRSLSLLGSIRIARRRFLELCRTGGDSKELGLLIRRGWIEHNEENDKIALHQIIQDLVYNDLKPDAENCPRLVESMTAYWNAEMANDSERRVRERVFRIFMERLRGSSLAYAGLCADYGEERYLDGAEDICRRSTEQRALGILQKIYRKKMKYAADCEDLSKTDMEWDEYCRYKVTEFTRLLDQTIEICKADSAKPEFLAKAFTEIGMEADRLFDDGLGIIIGIDRMEEADQLCFRITDVLEAAAQYVPAADLPLPEKEGLLKRIREFYSAKDLTVQYRPLYFADEEKAFWYQKQIDQMKRRSEEDDLSFDADAMTCSDMAFEYEQKEDYDTAIRYYEKAYDSGEEAHDWVLHNLALVYEKTGNMERAIECLEKSMKIDREYEKREPEYFVYNRPVCSDLIRMLVSEDRFHEAAQYAKELIHYNQEKILKEENSGFVTYMAVAYYYLSFMEKDPQQKERLWEESVRYYRMLDQKEELWDDLDAFLKEYLRRTEGSEEWFEEVVSVLERPNSWMRGKLIREILEYAISVCGQKRRFPWWHVYFLIRYSEYLNGVFIKEHSEAFRYAEQAQQFYDDYRLQDRWLQNLIYKERAESMANIEEYDDDQTLEVRRKCDYIFLTEKKLGEFPHSDKEAYEAWKDTGDRYGYIDHHKNRLYCLQEAMDVLLSAFDQWGDSRYNDYWSLAADMIQCHIHLGDREQAYLWIKKAYGRMLEHHRGLEKADIWERDRWNRRNQDLAERLQDLSYTEEAIYLYLYILYLSAAIRPDYHLTEDLCPDEQTDTLFYERLKTAIKGRLDDDAINRIVDLKEKILSLLEPWETKMKYVDLLQWFSENYEHQEIEFKR